ncbi:aldehyde:ferredoxin oxidoreductase [Desulfonatronum thiosulfatophilum]|uniref:Aldehyde:ferredoxin oxidoreductase n=1 Tax=Desulfonatronum thiosulfatophilum TaxID=617002 RepID=A0A1G6DB03_9BACT|nr:aldehyde ferredoxin oxidoreductase family protein [Desulfonatronum thiosulfatophilum]SDB42346.1 aldehyde:ferredoxin oxidoreductase [Desulfonatronum thiosulfatophilum]
MNSSAMGVMLHVDLTGGEFHDIMVPDWLQERYVGGKGFGAKMLLDLVPQGADPLGPDNVLMFLAGPLTATPAPAMRACVVTKSPLTNLFLDSYFGGMFGPEIKYAGYDALIITGRSPEPVYLALDHTGSRLHSARDVWGLDTLLSNQRIKQQLDDEGFKIANIGPAGENLVPYALICCEFNRQAGRGGAGAVMGSKNLKAIALKGNKLVHVHDPEGFKEALAQANREIQDSAECRSLMVSGTAASVEFANEAGLIPANNFSDGSSPLAQKLGEKGQAQKLWLSRAACFGCPIACTQMGAVRSGKHAPFVTDIVEYESAAMLGTNLGIGDPRAVAHLTKLCDLLGLDSMSTGACLGFVMEAAQNGLLGQYPEADQPAFGDVAAAQRLIEMIAHRQGEFGRLLGKGVRAAAAVVGPEAESLAQHVKGLEMPAWGPRGAPGMGLAYMTADRGACHQRGFPVGYEATGMEWRGKPVQALALEGKAELVVALQNYLAGTDCLVKCDFGAMGVRPETYARLLNTATGMDVDADFFDLLGERIWNTTRVFNLREGMDITQERLPKRFVQDPLPSGPHKGHRITDEDMRSLLQDYYRVRNWDEQGRPTPETLERTGVQTLKRVVL